MSRSPRTSPPHAIVTAALWASLLAACATATDMTGADAAAGAVDTETGSGGGGDAGLSDLAGDAGSDHSDAIDRDVDPADGGSGETGGDALIDETTPPDGDASAEDITPVDATPTDASPLDGDDDDSSVPDVSPVDASVPDLTPVDSGGLDVSPVDSGATDVSPVDSGVTDASPVDSGVADLSPVDSGATDVSPVDSWVPDLTPVDAWVPDLSPVDSGTTDASPVDAGADTELNGCGGTTVLPGEPGTPCGSCGGGVWRCTGLNAVFCDDPSGGTLNPCGGCAVLPGSPGDACGTCGSGVFACNGPSALTCTGDLGPAAYLTVFRDADGDGFGDPAQWEMQCVPGAGWSADSTDCDDSDGATHPGAEEVIGDEIDENCDRRELCFIDADGDFYRLPGDATTVSVDADCADFGEASRSTLVGDCNDINPSISPAAVEGPGDEVDQNCDGREICFVDNDDDGYRPNASSTTPSFFNVSCRDSGEALASEPTGDCNDDSAAARPGAGESCDGIDNDCDGLTDNADPDVPDADSDGVRACTDCNDNNPAIGAGGGTHNQTANGSVSITDYSTAQLPMSVGVSGAISDVNVRVTLTHSYDDDLEIRLVSPAGTSIILSSRNGDSGDDYSGTWFDDEAATDISDGSAPFSGTYRPSGLLSAFDGQSPTGTWRLEVEDLVGGDSGTLTAFELAFTLSCL